MSGEADFHPGPVLEVLLQRKVRFVLIGGLAARLHGSPSITGDVDICYSRDTDNLERLSSALVELHARLRGAPEDVPFVLDARTLAMGDTFTFDTDAGKLDVLATPSGTRGFEELDANAVPMRLDWLAIRVAAIDDLIRMKRAAGRAKDRVELEILGALRDEIERRNSAP